jgi:hypothetical protein
MESVNTKVVYSFTLKEWQLFNPTSMRLSEMFILSEKELLRYIKSELERGYKVVTKQYLIDKEDEPPPKYEDVRMLSLFDN